MNNPNMIYFFMLIIIGLLIYVLCELKKDKPKPKPQLPYKEILPQYLNKTCEITVKTPLPSIDIIYNIKGTLIAVDPEWIMLETHTKKKTTTKIFRISNISGIKEIITT